MSQSKKNVFLITGGAGFIGSHLAHYLSKRGAVRILDNFSTGFEKNIESLPSDVEVMRGDIRDFATCKQAIRGVDYIFHQAALPSVARSFEDPMSCISTNIEGTVNIFEAARHSHCKRIVYASSSSVYGDSTELPKHESMPKRPKSPYALSKAAVEDMAAIYTKNHGLELIGLRYFNVVGTRQDPTSQYAAVVPNFINAILSGVQPTIYGDGNQTRDFCPINNVVQMNVKAMYAPLDQNTPRIFNVACGRQYTVNGLAAMLNRIIGKNIVPQYTTERPGDIKDSLADISSAQKYLNYDPTYQSFDETLTLTVEWFNACNAL